MSGANSSAEVAILIDIAELAKRCGLRPSDADASIIYDGDDDEKTYRVLFAFRDHPNMERFQELLGVGENEEMWASDIGDLEDRLDKALSLAPRARVR